VGGWLVDGDVIRDGARRPGPGRVRRRNPRALWQFPRATRREREGSLLERLFVEEKYEAFAEDLENIDPAQRC